MTEQEKAENERAERALRQLHGLEDDLDVVWKPAAAARFLGVAVSTLAGWRLDGGGPDFVELSKTRVGYRKRALIAFIEARERKSTSEAPKGQSAALPAAGRAKG